MRQRERDKNLRVKKWIVKGVNWRERERWGGGINFIFFFVYNLI